MGKASKWLKGLLGFKKSEPSANPAQKPPAKKRWSFARSHKKIYRQKSQNGVSSGGYDDDEAGRHAVAVAAVTAAVAEAAVAAAQAAAAVAKLTSGAGSTHVVGSGRGFNSSAHVTQIGAGYGSREEPAAVIIQSRFRAYLSRRALKALKALVKLQALVRGQMMRKRYVDKLRQMKAIARAQARARAGVLISEFSYSSAKSSPLSLTERLDYTTLARSSPKQQEQLMMFKRNGSRSNNNVTASDQMISHKRRGERRSWEQGSFTTDDERILEVDTKSSIDVDGNGTTENSPQYYSASSSKTGRSSDCSRSHLSCYSDYPSYMATTQSSKAKVRSLSAPKQRPRYEKWSPARLNNPKPYPGRFSGVHWHRY